MKYVKLFESWLNTVNEAVDRKIDNSQLDAYGLLYDVNKKYNAESFAKEVVTKINGMFKDAPDYTIGLTSQVKGKEVVLFGKNKTDSFKFNFKPDFEPFEGIDPTILVIKGQGTVGTEYKDTTLAQFIDSVSTGSDLTADSDYDSIVNSVQRIIYIAKNNSLPRVSGKSKKVMTNISKMTAEQFFDLPEESKDQLFKTVLKGDFVFHRNPRQKNIFVITPSSKLAAKYNMDFETTGAGVSDSRYFAIIINPPGSDIDLKGSMANIPLTYGLSKNKSSVGDAKIYAPDKNDIADVRELFQGGDGNTTLAAFILKLRDLVSSGMKTADGKGTIGNQVVLSGAVNVDDSASTKKKAEEAWKKEGGPADMSLNTNSSKETTA